MTPDLYRLDEDGLDGRPFADIDVMRLVDVMLVLLVVFMMAAPLMAQGVPIDLPKGAVTSIEGSVVPHREGIREAARCSARERSQ